MISSLVTILVAACALGGEPKRLALADAERDVRAFIYAEKPTMSPDAQFPVKEITTDDVWSHLHLQLFQVTDGVQMHETFVLADGHVRRIGRGLGGFGVHSVVVADLDGNGRPELVYAYSWGSGEHRAHVAVFDALAKEPREFVAPETYFAQEDWTLERVDDRTVRVLVGKTVVGTVVFDSKNEKAAVSLRLDASLSDALREKIRGRSA